jgi:small-conductance mechanosensitive channel
MRPSRSCWLALTALLTSALVVLGPVLAKTYQDPVVTTSSGSDAGPAASPSGAPVEIDGRPIFQVYASVGGVPPQERAANIENRILRLARKRTLQNDLIRIEERGAWTEILVGQEVLMVVTEADAQAVGRSRSQLGEEYAEIIRHTVAVYRQEHTLGAFFWGLAFSLAATIGLLLVLFTFVRIRRVVRGNLQRLVNQTKENYSARSMWSRAVRYLLAPLIGTGIIVITAASVALLEIYLALVLSFFPSTRYISSGLKRWTISELTHVLEMVWAYLPNLVIAVMFLIAARALIRVNNYFFQEIREGTLKLHGFYPDWAEPTAKLVRLLILAMAAVVVFPYLPGSNSPAFRGISVFLGVLLSLGSTSAVAHGVAGTILTYMRSFNVGDFIKIGDTVGEVVEKTLLVTRIFTQKNEIVTIPNGSVLGGVVVNYSALTNRGGVIFYTKVSISYNAPWQKVHELLFAAAKATQDVLQSPEPFVLQSNLNDFYVTYELNVFTNRPQNMQFIYSALHQNIQDKFNAAGIEINSPHYMSLRDGNRMAIPEQSLPGGYEAPSFRARVSRDCKGQRPERSTDGEPSQVQVTRS